MPQHPVLALLTPDPAEAPLPAGFERVRAAIDQGLPAPIAVSGLGLDLLLSAPSARVRAWLEADAGALAADAAPQRAPHPARARGEEPRAGLAPVLIVTRGREPVALMPLVVNARALLPRRGLQSGEAVEIVILSFRITAEAMRGPRGGASFIELAWRRIDRGTNQFMAPVVRRSLRPRLLATTGTGAQRVRRSIETELYTETAGDASAAGLPGGLNWRLTHD